VKMSKDGKTDFMSFCVSRVMLLAPPSLRVSQFFPGESGPMIIVAELLILTPAMY
jgi:hypothetical protein